MYYNFISKNNDEPSKVIYRQLFSAVFYWENIMHHSIWKYWAPEVLGNNGSQVSTLLFHIACGCWDSRKRLTPVVWCIGYTSIW